MDSALLSLALTAGALAALNPCGFALLPAYLGLMMRDESVEPAGGARGAGRAALRAAGLAGVMTSGFLAVFVVFGLAVAPFAASVQEYLPWVTLATGVLLAGVGALMIVGRQLKVPGTGLNGRVIDGTLASTFSYGVTYALASLTCTVGPFLAVVVTSLRSSDILDGIVLFAVYAGGMGLVVGVAAVAVALARSGLVRTLRGTGRWLPRASGGLILVVGLYVAYYGLWEIRVLGGADPADPVIERALSVQSDLSGFVRGIFTFD